MICSNFSSVVIIYSVNKDQINILREVSRCRDTMEDMIEKSLGLLV